MDWTGLLIHFWGFVISFAGIVIGIKGAVFNELPWDKDVKIHGIKARGIGAVTIVGGIIFLRWNWNMLYKTYLEAQGG